MNKKLDNLTFEDVRKAKLAFGNAIIHTPTNHAKTISRITGADVFIKFENRQFTASFKERGALNKLLNLTPEQKKKWRNSSECRKPCTGSCISW